MSKKLKVMTVVGTRPEIIKMSRVIEKLDSYFEHLLVHTGQNYDYELNQIFFEELGVREPDVFLECNVDSVMCLIGDALHKVEKLIISHNPDAFLIYGDTNSCLSALAAKRNKVPIFHFEAGNRCFDPRVPEEINRKIVDHLSDVNFVLSEHARRYLISEGLRPDFIFKTGSHMYEIIESAKYDIEKSTILERLELLPEDYFLVSLHREENVDDKDKIVSILEALQVISGKYEKQIIFSTHPRTGKRIEEFGVKIPANLVFSKPFGFYDYCNLQKNAFCVISDSGTITEETSILNLNSVMLREMHERPEGVDVSAVCLSSLNTTALINSIDICINTNVTKKVEDYQNGEVSEMIIRIISSYIDIINREVWRKF